VGSVFALLLGTALECVSALWLMSGIASGHDFALVSCLHLTATGLITVACHRFLPPSSELRNRDIILAYGAVLVLCMPLFGEITALALIATLNKNARAPQLAWRVTELPEPPTRAVGTTGERYGEAALMGILCHSRNPEKRLRAVLATRQLEPRMSLPLLRRALSDPSEDVRLLAFSQLDSKQESLNQQIKGLLGEMDDSPDILHDPNMLAAMASRFWELVYLGYNNTQGDLSLLDRARAHLLRAIEHNPDSAELHFQIGRIQLKLGNLEQARSAFLTARSGGISKDELMPYLAECAFLSGRYSDIQPLLAEIDYKRRMREPFKALVAQWA